MMTQKSVQRGIENKKQTRVPRAFKIRVLKGGNARKIFKNVFFCIFWRLTLGTTLICKSFRVFVPRFRTEGFARTSPLKSTFARATPQAHDGDISSTPGTKAPRRA